MGRRRGKERKEKKSKSMGSHQGEYQLCCFSTVSQAEGRNIRKEDEIMVCGGALEEGHL